MAASIKVTGLEKVVESMRDLRKKQRPMINLVVGYDTPYAVRVHEDLQMPHPRGGQAKYLEEPMRARKNDLTAMINAGMRFGNKTAEEAMREAGEFLLAVSKKLVPVLTGRLRDSGYVRVDR